MTDIQDQQKKSNDTLAISALNETRLALEVQIFNCNARKKRTECDSAAWAEIEAQLVGLHHAYDTITSNRSILAHGLFNPSGSYMDNTLITALQDIKNWDDDIATRYGEIQHRAEVALIEYNGEAHP
jgi:hypothetical protein